MTERFFEAYEILILQRPWRALLVVGLIAVIAAMGLPRFKLDASSDSLTLEHDTSVELFREVNKRYGSGDFLVVTYTPKGVDLFSRESLDSLASLQKELEAVEGVTSVVSVLNVPLLYSPKISISDLSGQLRTIATADVDFELVKREFHNSPIYRDLILSPDGQTTALMVNFSIDARYLELVQERDFLRRKKSSAGLSAEEAERLGNVSAEFLAYRTAAAEQSRQRIDYIRSLVDGYRGRAELILGGPSMITADMIAFIKSDLRIFGATVGLFIILLLAVIFRQLPWVVLPLLTCLLSVEIVLGFLSWVDWRLTVISSNFVALLLIITLAITIHLVVRFREFLRDNPEMPRYHMVRDTVTFMFRPCFYTVLTTVVAFASLVVSDIRPVIDFGWMMTIGICVAFVLAFVVIPCGLLAWPTIANNDKGDNSAVLTLKFSALTEKFGGWILAIALFVAVLSGWGITQLKVENRFIDYFRSDTEIYRGLSVIDAKLGGTTPLDIIIDLPRKPDMLLAALEQGGDEYSDGGDPFGEEDPFADPFADSAAEKKPPTELPYWFTGEGIRKLDKLHRYLETLPEVGKVSSLATVYQVAGDLMEKQLNDLELALVRKSVTGANADLLIKPYLDEELGQVRILVRAKETEGNLRRSELLAKIAQYGEQELGIDRERIAFTGLLVLYNNMLQSLFQSQILTLGAVFLGITVMFLVLFRSLSLSLIAIVPSMLAAAVVLGFMGLMAVPLDMMTITIAAITVGIGVDNAIHYIHRFRREFARDNNYIASMHRSHGSIGRAMYYTSVSIVVGFSVLVLSQFIPSVYFGLLTGLAMATALLGALLLLPKLLLLFKPLG